MRVEEFMERVMQKFQEEEEAKSPLAKFICDCDYSEIGNCVCRKSELTKGQINTAVAICRRRFTKDDIILFDILDDYEEGEEGIVFTESAIYHWRGDETLVAEVSYEEIARVDYEGDYVYLYTEDDEVIEMYCGEDAGEEKYTRYMYNFISDILDFLEKEKKEEMGSFSKELRLELPEVMQEEVLLLPQAEAEIYKEEVEE